MDFLSVRPLMMYAAANEAEAVRLATSSTPALRWNAK